MALVAVGTKKRQIHCITKPSPYLELLLSGNPSQTFCNYLHGLLWLCILPHLQTVPVKSVYRIFHSDWTPHRRMCGFQSALMLYGIHICLRALLLMVHNVMIVAPSILYIGVKGNASNCSLLLVSQIDFPANLFCRTLIVIDFCSLLSKETHCLQAITSLLSSHENKGHINAMNSN